MFALQPFPWLPLLLLSVRLLLVLVFLVSNYLPSSRSLAVLVHWDWILATTVSIFSMLGGFLSHHITAAIIRSSRSEQEASLSTMRTRLLVMLGAVAGLAFSFLLPAIVRMQL